MNQMPPEILLMIFESLDINSLLCCRKVCRKWFFISKSLKVSSLAISDSFDKVDNYFHSNKQIKQSTLLTTTTSKFMRSKFMKLILINLKQLYIKNAPHKKKGLFTFENLNEFIHLEQLEIDFLKTRRHSSLVLKNLKILTIQNGTNVFIKLMTPNLKMFKTCEQLERFTFLKPEILTHLSLEFCHNTGLAKFNNLEVLYVKKAQLLNTNDILNILPSLKVLSCREMYKPKAIDLLKQVKVLRKLNFEIHVSGIHIENVDDVDNYIDFDGKLKYNLTQTYQTHYFKLTNVIPWSKEINYSKFIQQGCFLKKISDDFLQDFFKRFINIRKVNITFTPDQKVDLKFLKNFLQHCTYIDELLLINVAFNQSFYDILHVICPYLSVFEIEEKKETLDNIDFVFDHRYLNCFKINRKASFEQLEKAFKMLSFESFTFKMNGRVIRVASVKNSKYIINIESNEATFDFKYTMLKFLREALFSDLNYIPDKIPIEFEEEEEEQPKREVNVERRSSLRKRT